MDNLPSKHYVRQTPYSLRPYAISQAEFLSHRPAIRRILSSAIVFHPASASSPLRTLLLRRAATDYFPLLWETPGGSVDEDDLSIIEAAKREVKEEAGLAVKTAICCVPIPEGSLSSASTSSLVKNGDVKWEDVYKFEDNGAVVTFPEPGTDWSWAKITFLMEVEGDGEVVLQPEEHVDYRWVTEEEVAEGRFKARDGQGEEEEEGIAFVSEVVRAAVLEGFRIKKEVLRVREENRDRSEN